MKGLLITPDLLRAYAEGRKTVTRRPIKFALMPNIVKSDWHAPFVRGEQWEFTARFGLATRWQIVKPPYQVGEVVYLKEAWRVGAWDEDCGLIAVDYRADGFCRKEFLPVPEEQFESLWIQSTDDALKVMQSDVSGRFHWEPGQSPCRWRSPLFMPAWAARHFQWIVRVRPERLQEIMPIDCVAEGIIEQPGDGLALLDRFVNLWDSLYPKYPWASNCWVWRIESERAEKPEKVKD